MGWAEATYEVILTREIAEEIVKEALEIAGS